MYTFLIFSLIILFIQVVANDTANSALCFLTLRPAVETLEFAEELAFDGQKYGVDVFVMIDDNSYKPPSSISSLINILQIPNEKCVVHGYINTMYVTTRPINISSWDKTFLYFCEINTNYSFVWFVEDDTFIPSVHAFRSVHQLYADTTDLIATNISSNPFGEPSVWTHWNLAVDKLFPPWYSSMANAIGMSRRLLKTIADYVRWRGVSTYHEFFPQTLSRNLNMTVVSPIELETLVYEANYTWNDIENKPNNWWHPVKDLKIQKLWRQRIVDESSSNRSNIEWSKLTKLCKSNNNATLVSEYLSKLTIDFGESKVGLSSNKRRSLRQHFLLLAEQCKQLHDFKSAKIIELNLADSAYKLPESPRFQLVTKSSTHLLLEKALVENKQYVYQFLTNCSVLNRLREEAKNLTLELTREIQREMKQQHNERDGKKASTHRAWAGANSFFAWTLPQDDQVTLINTLRENNVRVIRIFLATIDANQAGSRALAANDIERYHVGSPYTDNDMVDRVDKFIENVATYGAGRIKLIVALHDRYALGCYAYKADGYVAKYGIPTASACSPPNDASKFYFNEQAQNDFVARLTFLLNHINPHFGQRWGSLNRTIFAFEIENESQGYTSTYNAQWMCGINVRIRSLVDNGVLLSTGGGVDFGLSLRLENFQCSALDLISLHDYNMNGDYARSKFQEAIKLAQQYNKRVYVEEFGGRGDTQAAQALNVIGATAHEQGLPWLVWEVVPNAKTDDFEFFTNDPTAWAAYQHQAYWAQMSPSPFSWPELWS